MISVSCSFRPRGRETVLGARNAPDDLLCITHKDENFGHSCPTLSEEPRIGENGRVCKAFGAPGL
jgi:hypothetical protein